MTESISPELAPPRARRTWLHVAVAGCALVVVTLVVVALVIIDKPHFGWLVGPRFLPIIGGGIYLGAALLLLGTWNLPNRKSWRSFVLFGWTVIALTSPLFGIMFLLPFGVLALTLPVVIAIFIGLYRGVA